MRHARLSLLRRVVGVSLAGGPGPIGPARSGVSRLTGKKLSKKSGRPQNEGVRSLRNGAKGLLSLRYAGDFCARDATERLFRQFQKITSQKFVFRSSSSYGARREGKGEELPFPPFEQDLRSGAAPH